MKAVEIHVRDGLLQAVLLARVQRMTRMLRGAAGVVTLRTEGPRITERQFTQLTAGRTSGQ